MKNFRLFFTMFFLLASLLLIILAALFDNQFFTVAADLIKNNIWAASIALFILLVLLSTGIVSNHADFEESLINNGYFQLAILEFFMITAGLGYYRYYSQQPGQLLFRLQPESTRNFINIAVTQSSAEDASTDTLKAPGSLENQPAGKYIVETVDRDIIYFRAEVILEPAETKTVEIPVRLNVKTLSVQTEPEGADIWLNEVQASKTPATFDIITGDTVILDLKMEGYQVYSDTISMHEDVNLGTISLQKLFTVWIASRYEDINYRIYDSDNNVVFSSYGSRKIQLAQGRYRIAFEIGEGQYESKRFSVNYNLTVTLP